MNEYFILGFVSGFLVAILLWMYSRYIKSPRTNKNVEEIEIEFKVDTSAIDEAIAKCTALANELTTVNKLKEQQK